MDAIDLIKQDHRRIEELFDKFLEPESETVQEDLYQEIQDGLSSHAQMEIRVLYPAMKQFASDKVDAALKEYSKLKELLAELLDADLNEGTCECDFKQLMDDVRHHIEEEESPDGLLELARQKLDAGTLAQMAAEMTNIKRNAGRDMAA